MEKDFEEREKQCKHFVQILDGLQDNRHSFGGPYKIITTVLEDLAPRYCLKRFLKHYVNSDTRFKVSNAKPNEENKMNNINEV